MALADGRRQEGTDARTKDDEKGQKGNPGHRHMEVDDAAGVTLATDRVGDEKDAVRRHGEEHQADVWISTLSMAGRRSGNAAGATATFSIGGTSAAGAASLLNIGTAEMGLRGAANNGTVAFTSVMGSPWVGPMTFTPSRSIRWSSRSQ